MDALNYLQKHTIIKESRTEQEISTVLSKQQPSGRKYRSFKEEEKQKDILNVIQMSTFNVIKYWFQPVPFTLLY